MNRASDNENFINGKDCRNRIRSLSRCQSLNLFLFTLSDAFAKIGVDTMTVHLPSESKIEMSTANNSHAEILIVDDDALSRKILAQVTNVCRLRLRGVRERCRSIEDNSRQAAFASVARFRYAGGKWRGGVKTPSLGSTPGSRTGANHHVDRARKRGKRSLLFAGWRG